MAKVKSFLWFSGKVFLAFAVANLIISFLPANIAAALAAFQANPRSLLNNG